jgi:hypothetical protein
MAETIFFRELRVSAAMLVEAKLEATDRQADLNY